MTLNEALTRTSSQLHDIPESSKEALTLLAFVLGRDPSWIIAHQEESLSEPDDTRLQELAARRAQHEPMAYVLGHQPFYGFDFIVNPDVLIPRPESELIIDDLLRESKTESPTIIDVGTGSGCLAISAAKHLPQARVLAIDISEAALRVAEENKARLNAHNVDCRLSDLLAYCVSTHVKADVILANLPYLPSEEIAASPTSAELAYEPRTALVAPDQGLALMKQCIEQSLQVLKPGGKIYLEMLPDQLPMVSDWLMQRRLPFSSRQIADLSGKNRILVLTLLVGRK